MPSFQATATVLGLLLMLGALASGLAQRSFLSLTALFVLAGFLLGPGGFSWIDFRARSGFVEDLAFAALIVILFRDGLEVEGEMLEREWHLPARKLVLAMPITAAIVAAAAHELIGFSWTESFLIGALLSPTDPVLTSSIVTNLRVPRLVRHSLNLESGLNDGLALPAVLALLAALSVGSASFHWGRFVIQDLGLGLIYGLACGWLASLLMPRERQVPHAWEIPSTEEASSAQGIPHAREIPSAEEAQGAQEIAHAKGIPSAEEALGAQKIPHAEERPDAQEPPREHEIPAHQKSLFALGVAFATYGVTVLTPEGNGFIAVFVAAIVLGIRRPDLRVHFEERADELVEIVKLGIFFVFGSLLTFNALTREGWTSVVFVAVVFLLARPLAVWVALLGTRTDRATRLFMGWFGPKGVATMTFALLVLDQNISSGTRIFDLTALVVFCSILLHGLSDTPGANWIARHAARTADPSHDP